jgi:hypothetical protein
MYVNAKVTLVETVIGIREGEEGGEQWRGVEFKYDLLDTL